MSDGDLLCNFKSCRKVLTGTAYITRCSHAFCEDDGIKQIESQHFEKKCPACQSPLVKNYDLVKVTLNPTDQFKSMVLAGLRPEVVMDIATRAVMFWTYQQHQEQLHQTMITKSLKDFISQTKSEAEIEAGFLKSEILNLKKKQEDLEKEIKKHIQKCHELAEKIAQKNRELQKWQVMYESLRRKQLSAAMMHQETKTFQNPIALEIGPQTIDDLCPMRTKNLPRDCQGLIKNCREGINVSKNNKFPIAGNCDNHDTFIFQPRAMNASFSPKNFLESEENYRN